NRYGFFRCSTSFYNRPLKDEDMLSLISSYLIGWENAVGARIADRDKNLGPFSKISGFRFMISMLPAFWEQAIKEERHLHPDYISGKIKSLFAEAGMEARDLFDKNSEYIRSSANNPFVSETSIALLAKEWSGRLKSLTSGNFNPLAM
ncbi:MAG: hypothetical protein LUE24_08850, partial [Lachnospiraceae bacterium]|nr:hypothetical protein [Lachnospiraceae bacterium]